jgi:hypothetical protein
MSLLCEHFLVAVSLYRDIAKIAKDFADYLRTVAQIKVNYFPQALGVRGRL